MPCFAVQCAASILIVHFVPLLVVRQQVTARGLPHVERDAHFLTEPAQCLLERTVFACCAAHVVAVGPRARAVAVGRDRCPRIGDVGLVGLRGRVTPAWLAAALTRSAQNATAAARHVPRADGSNMRGLPFPAGPLARRHRENRTSLLRSSIARWGVMTPLDLIVFLKKDSANQDGRRTCAA